MSYENEAHGDEDVLAEPSKRDSELALEQVVETIMLHGMWPAPKRGGFTRSQFDLYDFLNENRDPSYFLEMYIAVLTGADMFNRNNARLRRWRKCWQTTFAIRKSWKQLRLIYRGTNEHFRMGCKRLRYRRNHRIFNSYMGQQ